MSNFYCISCGLTNDDPESEECSSCAERESYCRYCGAPGEEETCDSCQELLDDDAFDSIFDEEDEEYLRVPFHR